MIGTIQMAVPSKFLQFPILCFTSTILQYSYSYSHIFFLCSKGALNVWLAHIFLFFLVVFCYVVVYNSLFILFSVMLTLRRPDGRTRGSTHCRTRRSRNNNKKTNQLSHPRTLCSAPASSTLSLLPVPHALNRQHYNTRRAAALSARLPSPRGCLRVTAAQLQPPASHSAQLPHCPGVPPYLAQRLSASLPRRMAAASLPHTTTDEPLPTSTFGLLPPSNSTCRRTSVLSSSKMFVMY